MAHSASLKAACRAAYIDNMPLTQIAKAQNVPLATLRSWKRRALEQGDDWDKLRAANLLAGEGMEAVARQTLSDYVLQHKALMGEIIEAQDMTAREKTQALPAWRTVSIKWSAPAAACCRRPTSCPWPCA